MQYLNPTFDRPPCLARPVIFFKPGGGFNPAAFTIEPGKAYPCEDPAGVNVVKIMPNLEYAIQRQQDIFAVAERVTGISDQSMGRTVDRPNAPRTATGQLALIEEGNIRAYLDSSVLREDMEQIVADFWDLDCDLVPRKEPGLFFRVTAQLERFGAMMFEWNTKLKKRLDALTGPPN